MTRPSSPVFADPAMPEPAPDALLEAVPVALLRFALDGRLLAANRLAHELLELEATGADGQVTLDAVFGDAHDQLAPLVRAARDGRPVSPALVRRSRTDGDLVLEVVLASLPGGELLASASDVTAREALLETLDLRARELAAIFEVSSSSVRVIDADGRIVRANTAALDEHPGERPRTLAELLSREQPLYPTTRQRLSEDAHPATRALQGEMVRGERYVVLRGLERARRIVETHASPVMSAGRTPIGAVLVTRDVTEQHRLATELKDQVRHTAELNERVSSEAERLDRMVDERSRELLALQEARARDRRLSAVGQLAAGVMHDVNNALNPIMAAAWLLDRHADNPEAVRDYARRIARAAETGAASAARVGRFLRQEPIDSGVRTVVDLAVVCEEALQLTEPLLAKRPAGDLPVTFVRALMPGTTVSGVSGELREVVLNLLQNAVDAMPDGGTLTVRTLVHGSHVHLDVCDSGLGMSDEVRDRAFEPFFSTKGAGGSGLGLAEVYGIVRRHRGTAEIESTLGGGTTVRCAFPYAPTEVAAPASVSDGAPVRARRILLVEDHDDGREFMRRVLVAGGHAVDATASCAEARTSLSNGAAPYDVLITDIGLPGGSGWELVREARASGRAAHVGVVTGWEPVTRGTDAVDFILRKPLRAAELLASIARLEPPASKESPHA